MSIATTSTPLAAIARSIRSEEHTSELQSQFHLVCRLLLEKKKKHHDSKTPATTDIKCILTCSPPHPLLRLSFRHDSISPGPATKVSDKPTTTVTLTAHGSA